MYVGYSNSTRVDRVEWLGSVKKRNHKHHFTFSRTTTKTENCTTPQSTPLTHSLPFLLQTISYYQPIASYSLLACLLSLSNTHHTSMMQQIVGMENNSELFQFLAASNNYSNISFFDATTTAAMQQQHSFCSSSSINYYPLQEVSEITDAPSQQERALAAMKNHKEAEKRRRERINSHLDQLRTLLPCNSKVTYPITTYISLYIHSYTLDHSHIQIRIHNLALISNIVLLRKRYQMMIRVGERASSLEIFFHLFFSKVAHFLTNKAKCVCSS